MRTAVRLDRSSTWASILLELYEGESEQAIRFRYGLLLVDLTTIIYLVVTSFVEWSVGLEVIDGIIGLIVLADSLARLSISRHRVSDLLHPLGMADIAVMISFLAPVAGQGLGFLRVLRMLRLFRSYHMTSRLKRDVRFVQRNYDMIIAVTNLVVFLFGMTAVVYETQHWENPTITNYADALYFTVTTLTTTGFGDITLRGTTGRILSIVMMLAGVSLFMRLVQVLLRPSGIHCRCPTCGLARHETDAVHCRHCGTQLRGGT